MSGSTPSRIRAIPVFLIGFLALGGVLMLRPAPASARIAAVPAPDAAAAAREIDAIVARFQNEHGAKANPVCDDETFLRRLYLSAIGRVPTTEEARRFLDSQDSQRRAKLVDELLDSKGWVSHRFNRWADLLRIKSRLGGQVSGAPYEHWLKDALATNKPYDRMVTELLTANGAAHARDNGATGYYLRDRGMPQDNMANTMRLFLGTRIECAQCHNHPFDKWTQLDFFKLSAFTADLVYRDVTTLADEKSAAIREVQQEIRRSGDRSKQQAFNLRILRGTSAGISHTGSGLAMLPKDYQYDDAKGGDIVQAQVPFGEQPALKVRQPNRRQLERLRRAQNRPNRRGDGFRFPPVNSRAAFAEWVTSPQNDRFSAVAVNRAWQEAMGVGLVEPVDDFGDDTEAMIPELLRHLQDYFVATGFDLKELQRAIFLSRTWQREAVTEEWTPGEVWAFRGPTLRRLSAEQTWDSLVTLVDRDVDAGLEAPLSEEAERVYAQHDRVYEMTADELRAEVDRFEMRRQDPAKFRAEERRRLAALREKAAPVLRELRLARRAQDRDRERAALAKLEELGLPQGRPARRGNRDNRTVRASDLPQPAPAGHFLGRFGQSDREVISGAQLDPNVPQVLDLLNGFVEEQILSNPLASLIEELDGTQGVEARIRLAYLAILSRRPDAEELGQWRAEIRRDSDEGLADLVWTLVNSHEFRFLR
ncbi:MAG: DUF1549 domain-containing protein [Planctomycetota bacterium]